MSLILSGTDGLSDVDGTAATPAIRGTDTNTGIFFPAADTIAFSEGGVEALRLNSSGQIAASTDGTASVPVFTRSTDTNTGLFFPAADTVAASVGGTEGLRLTTTGLTTQQDATVYGVRVGRGAGAVSSNTAVGASALGANTSGIQNTGLGANALQYQTNNNNTALGYNAMVGVNGSSNGGSNTAVGSNSLAGLTGGNFNTAIGQQSLLSNTTASYNTAVGFRAAYSNTTGSALAAFGSDALFSNTTGVANTAVGTTDGVSVGGALRSNTTGSYNTAVGQGALVANTTASNSTAIGRAALSSLLTSQSVAVGSLAGYQTTTGGGLVAIGYAALGANTTGTSNTGIGTSYNTDPALASNTTGSFNVAVGEGSLAKNTTASNNTAVGYQAGYSNTTGAYNTVIGYQAGYSLSGTGNTLNTFVGQSAGYNITTGTKNTIIGTYNGNQGGLDIRTASNHIVLSDGDGNPRAYSNGSGVWTFASRLEIPNNEFVCGGGTTPSVYRTGGNGSGIHFSTNCGIPTNETGNVSDNTESWGNAGYRWTVIYATTGTINTSDREQKQDIQDLSSAELAVAQEIKTLFKTFRWKNAVAQKGDAARIHVGVIAQDVQAAFAKHGLDATRYALWCSDTWYEVDGKGISDDGIPYTAQSVGAVEKTRLGIRYDQLLVFVIAAL